MKRWVKKLGLLFLSLIVLWRLSFFLSAPAPRPQLFGVSFAASQAEYLGLEPRAAYLAILDELGVKELRLSAYWNRIEKQPEAYDFSELDFEMDEAAKRGAQVILAVGRRLPRWPECHDPIWAKGLSEELQQVKVQQLVERTVERYKDHPVLKLWQVENEPFLNAFGECPKIPRKIVKDEIELVKKLDPKHPTMTTDSGELATWLRTAHLADYLGSTMYRVVWNEGFPISAFVSHENTIPPIVYPIKALIVGKPRARMMLSEVQAEAWAPRGIPNTSIETQFKSMDIERFKRTVQAGKRTGFPSIYLWGAEWWLWLKGQGYPEHWELAKTIFAS